MHQRKVSIRHCDNLSGGVCTETQKFKTHEIGTLELDHSLAPLTHSLYTHRSLCSRAPLASLARSAALTHSRQSSFDSGIFFMWLQEGKGGKFLQPFCCGEYVV